MDSRERLRWFAVCGALFAAIALTVDRFRHPHLTEAEWIIDLIRRVVP